MDRHYVYLIGGVNSPFVKIGLTYNLEQRLHRLNTSSPYPLQAMGYFVCVSRIAAFELESHLHRAFRSKRRNGEWFEVSYLEIADHVLGDDWLMSKIVNYEVKSPPPTVIKEPVKHTAPMITFERIGSLILAAIWVFMYVAGFVGLLEQPSQLTPPLDYLLHSVIGAITIMAVSIAANEWAHEWTP